MLSTQKCGKLNKMLSPEKQAKCLAERLREEREKRHISQIDLALEAGLSQNIVAFIETGKRSPNVLTILKICNALEISPATLFESETAQNRRHIKSQIVSLLEQL